MLNEQEKRLFPLVLEYLINKQSQSDVMQSLHNTIFQQVREQFHNNVQEFNIALAHCFDIGQSLGLLSITDTIVKLPFNMHRVTKPNGVKKNGSHKGTTTGKVLPKRVVKKKSNITLKKTAKQRGSKHNNAGGTKRRNLTTKIQKNSIALIKSLWREMEIGSRSDVRQNLKMAFALGKALGSLTSIETKRSELPSTYIKKGRGKAYHCGDRQSRNRIRSQRPCERCVTNPRSRSRSRSHSQRQRQRQSRCRNNIRSRLQACSQSKSRAQLANRLQTGSRSQLPTRVQPKFPQSRLVSESEPKPDPHGAHITKNAKTGLLKINKSK